MTLKWADMVTKFWYEGRFVHELSSGKFCMRYIQMNGWINEWMYDLKDFMKTKTSLVRKC